MCGRAAAACLTACLVAAAPLPYQDPELPEWLRLSDLLGRLNDTELVQQLGGPALPAVPRLGLGPVQQFGECLAGLGQVNVSTSWPMPIGLAASFDPALFRAVGSALADEARGHRNAFGDFKQVLYHFIPYPNYNSPLLFASPLPRAPPSHCRDLAETCLHTDTAGARSAWCRSSPGRATRGGDGETRRWARILW